MTNIILMDGGMGQELLRRSAIPPHPLWSAKVLLEEPEIVQAVHEDFIRAGARLITLNTYSATPERLEREGVPELFKPLQARAIDLARAARANVGVDGVGIAACLPPLHGSYKPDMSRSHDDLLPAYREIATRQAGSVDVILCETLSSVSEVTAATQAGVETGLPTFTSMTMMDDGSARLRSGEPLADALDAIEDMGQVATLLNCSRPEIIDANLPALLARFEHVGAYANGFTSIDALDIGGTVKELTARKGLTPEAYSGFAMGWVNAGASIVGGCCEVGPAHIEHLANSLKNSDFSIQGALA